MVLLHLAPPLPPPLPLQRAWLSLWVALARRHRAPPSPATQRRPCLGRAAWWLALAVFEPLPLAARPPLPWLRHRAARSPSLSPPRRRRPCLG